MLKQHQNPFINVDLHIFISNLILLLKKYKILTSKTFYLFKVAITFNFNYLNLYQFLRQHEKNSIIMYYNII